MPKPTPEVREALAVANACRTHIAGHHPAIQGAALAELLSIWLAGHPADMRPHILQMHIDKVCELTEVNAKIIRKI